MKKLLLLSVFTVISQMLLGQSSSINPNNATVVNAISQNVITQSVVVTIL